MRKFSAYMNRVLIASSVRQADSILTVSNAIMAEIKQEFKIGNNKIKTVYPAVNRDYPKINLEQAYQFSKGKKYFLFIGSKEPRKNLLRIINAFGMLPRNVKIEYQLLIVGPKGWGNAFSDSLKLVEKLDIKEEVSFIGFVSNDMRTCLYRSATLLLFPSIYEGFGSPIVEGMSLGVPVITSNLGAMKEVAGGAAYLVDPFSVNSIKKAIEEIVSSEGLRSQLIEKGYERVKFFDWDVAAKMVYYCLTGMKLKL